MPHKYLQTMFLAAVLGMVVMIPQANAATRYVAAEPFNVGWLELLRQEAVTKGIRQDTVDRLLPITLKPLDVVVQERANQPEFRPGRNALATYLEPRLKDSIVARGVREMNDNAGLLRNIEARYRVPPHLLMAIWSMESAFGQNTGDVEVLPALVTLARDNTDFRPEIFAALKLYDEGYTEIATRPGSRAGCFGQTQFTARSFHSLGVDGDGDGRIDIWNNLSDIFASTANHLIQSGWKPGERWGREVVLPEGFNRHLLTDLKKERAERSKTLAEWAQLGIRLPGGGALPHDYNKTVTIIAPNYNPKTDTVVNGPVYVVYDNFWAILEYNSSYKYSLAVNMLADKIKRQAAAQSARQPE